MKMYYTYVLRSSKDKRWYTGYTCDLRKRFSEHNCNKVSSTKGRGPFEMIYYEACIDKEDAISREIYLKSGMGKRYLKNRLKRFLSLTGFAGLSLRGVKRRSNLKEIASPAKSGIAMTKSLTGLRPLK